MIKRLTGFAGDRLKRWLPKGLLGRAMLILVAPMVLLQLVVAYVFIERHWDGVTRHMTEKIVQELQMLVGFSDAGQTEALNFAARSLDIAVYFTPGATVTPELILPTLDVAKRAAAETIARSFDSPMIVDGASFEWHINVLIQRENGVLRLMVPKRRMIASRSHVLLVWMISAALILMVVAALFLRNQIKPIRQLAAAAEAFGKGRSADPPSRGGSLEVRQAATAFRQMRARIERHVEQRTMMLSGVGHDLRTPLTRMALELELMDPGPEVDGLRRDVDEMRSMIDGYLNFARGEAAEETEETDLRALLEGLVANHRRAGGDILLRVRLSEPGAARMSLRPASIRRSLQNLIDNAARYGARIEAELIADQTGVTVAIDDDGPGIPADRREEAFKPFTRLDPARNQNDGPGVGLGLAIARDAARAHGGTLTLGAARIGGLRAALWLPK